MSLAAIKQLESGANFHRVDLHIHSYGSQASYDVTDNQMTVQNIIDTTLDEGISIISITDHNEIGNVLEAIKYSEGKKILVIPGIELSTSQGHLLVYFNTYDQLRSFYGELSISPDKKQCDMTITNALDIAKKYNGFGMAAHIDTENGFETYSPGYTPFKEAILNHPNLIGLEISDQNSINWFTEQDDNQDRKRLFRQRKDFLGEDNTYDIAKIMSSDSHSLSELGRNSKGEKKLTRIKADTLTFDSLRIALLESSSRIRIEQYIPETIPRFVGIEFEGGFLDNQKIRFSNNFNCLIGGRGTGKSTILEAIRVTSGNRAKEGFVDNEVWPDKITLYYQDESGQMIEFSKEKLKNLINISDPQNGLYNITVESFGQGETASTIQKCGENPEILLDFIDNFVEIKQYKFYDEELRNNLLQNQSILERLKLEVDRIPQIKQALINSKKQLEILNAGKAKEIVELEKGLANERVIRSGLKNELNELIQNINEGLNTDILKETIKSVNEGELIVGKQEFKKVTNLLDNYIKSLSKHSSLVQIESDDLKKQLDSELSIWKGNELEVLRKIDIKRKSLEASGIKLDISFIRKVTKDVSEYDAKYKELELKKNRYNALKKERLGLMKKRKLNLDNLFKERYEFIYSVNQKLKSTVIEYEVDLSIEQHKLSKELDEIIKTAMGWRTSRVPKATKIVESIPYFDLIKAIYNNNPSILNNVKDEYGNKVFNKDEAEQILRNLSQINVLSQIERAEIKDLLIIKIKKRIINNDKSVTIVERDFSKLSMGQQQSILLTLLLFSKRNCPLVIDQPEDNLDSEFVYRTLVTNLKLIKECRQVIIATHNANIAVLGDSELIIPLKSTNEKTSIVERGSIDNDKTKLQACNILEGGISAFKKRQRIYNIL